MERTFTRRHLGGSGPPLVLIHGFTDTWRSWELVLERLERSHQVLAMTLPGHAGGAELPSGAEALDAALVEGVLHEMDAAGMATAHVAGNSLGGFLAFKLAEHSRARTITALAPAGGLPTDDPGWGDLDAYFTRTLATLQDAVPYADKLVAAPKGLRVATQMITTNYRHIPPSLIAHQIRGAAACTGAPQLLDFVAAHGWTLDAARITCPVRIVWGTADQLLPWPHAATRWRTEWAPQAEYVELDAIGHCPQLDVPLETAELIAGFAAP